MSAPAATTGPVRVVGTGLLGASIGLALRGLGVDVVLHDPSRVTVLLARDVGAGRLAEPGDPPPEWVEDLKSAGWDADEFSILDAATRYPSAVGWRELVAMEGPRDLYEDIMRLLHHDEPLVQARSITETLDAAGEEARAKGGRTTLAPGFEEMRKFQRPPTQFE